MGGAAKAGIAVSAAVAVLALCLLGWIGGELHYRNCLQGAELRYPVAFQVGPGGKGNVYLEALEKPRAHFAFYKKAERDRAISSCSRWP